MKTPIPRRFIARVVGRMICEDTSDLAEITLDLALSELRETIMERYWKERADIERQENAAQSDESEQ